MSRVFIEPATDILGLIDVQPTFMPGGELAVADGEAVVAPINRLLAHPFQHAFATQDWHPADHPRAGPRVATEPVVHRRIGSAEPFRKLDDGLAFLPAPLPLDIVAFEPVGELRILSSAVHSSLPIALLSTSNTHRNSLINFRACSNFIGSAATQSRSK